MIYISNIKKLGNTLATISIATLFVTQLSIQSMNNKPTDYSPNPFEIDSNTPLFIEEISPKLKEAVEKIKKLYYTQLTSFKESAAPLATPLFIKGGTVSENTTSLKNATTDLINKMSQGELQENAKKVRAITIKMINNMQAIDGNLQTYFDTFPNSTEYKEILDTTIKKLTDLSTELWGIGNEYNLHRLNVKNDEIINIYKKQYPKLNPYEIQLLVTCTNELKGLIKIIIETTQEMMRKVTVTQKPQKSKNIFKRIFSKKN